MKRKIAQFIERPIIYLVGEPSRHLSKPKEVALKKPTLKKIEVEKRVTASGSMGKVTVKYLSFNRNN
jgi:hypothetical protein